MECWNAPDDAEVTTAAQSGTQREFIHAFLLKDDDARPWPSEPRQVAVAVPLEDGFDAINELDLGRARPRTEQTDQSKVASTDKAVIVSSLHCKTMIATHWKLLLLLLLAAFIPSAVGFAIRRSPPRSTTALYSNRRAFLAGIAIAMVPTSSMALKPRNEALCGTGLFTNFLEYRCTEIGDISDEGQKTGLSASEAGAADSLMSKLNLDFDDDGSEKPPPEDDTKKDPNSPTKPDPSR